jgi:carbonic anhydrase
MKTLLPALAAALASACATVAPSAAPGPCGTDLPAQSPIAIAGAVPDPALPAVTVDYPRGPGRLFDTGHTLQVALPPGRTLEVGGRRYEAQQFHLHWPAEHHLGADTFPAEIHLVHASPVHGNAVLGVWVRMGAHNPAWDSFFARLPVGRDTVTLADVDLRALLGLSAAVDVPRLFRYCGSLTTPPYMEGIQWLVRGAPIEMDEAQLRRLREAMEHNSREVQPVNGRRIEYRPY